MDYIKKFKLTNKLIFLLGGNGLIGNEIKNSIISAGGKVIVLDKIIKKTKINSKNLFYVKFDVSKLDNLELRLKSIKKKYGTPDIFINSSYPRTSDWKSNSFKRIKYKSFEKNIKIHLNSFSWTAKIIADLMIASKKKGSIIQLSSIYGVVGQDLNIYEGTNMEESMTYSVIKGGINNLTRQMASYYGRFDIRVNSICAGGVKDITHTNRFIKNYSKKAPLKRLALSHEIASGVLFLASDASSYITGSNLMIDGGWTAV